LTGKDLSIEFRKKSGMVNTKFNIVRVIKSRRMRWAGHVARMWEGERSVQGFGVET